MTDTARQRTVLHPLVDFAGEGYTATETRAPVVFLSGGRASLLSQAAEEKRTAVLVTDELSRLTPAFASVWREAGAGWVVRSRAGLREGFSGRKLGTVGEVLTAAGVQGIDDVDLGFLKPAPADAVVVSAIVSLRHPARATTVLGGPAERLADLATGRPPRVWGAHEPAGNRWDREQLTAFARGQMPGPVLALATGHGYSATIMVQRTSSGLEEITEAQLSLGIPSTVAFEDQRQRLLRYLVELSGTGMPLVALLLARPGNSDLLVPPLLSHPPSPLALLVGPPGVRGLEVDVHDMVERFGAVRVGRPRIPGLLFDLGTVGEPTWVRLSEIIETLGTDQVAESLGLSRRHTDAPARTDGR